MKYLESYYKYNKNDYTIDDLKVGYYVKANYGSAMDPDVVKFLDTHFGIIKWIKENKNSFEVAYNYNDVPDNIRNYFLEVGFMRLEFDISGLIEFAPTKKELELKLALNKYNL